jgi:glucose dehydrogenase
MHTKWTVALSAGAVLSVVLHVAAQLPATARNEWPMYRHDYAGTGASPLAQITAQNVGTLRQIWMYRLQNEPAPAAPGRGGGAGAPNS